VKRRRRKQKKRKKKEEGRRKKKEKRKKNLVDERSKDISRAEDENRLLNKTKQNKTVNTNKGERPTRRQTELLGETKRVPERRKEGMNKKREGKEREKASSEKRRYPIR
jgi:hypothetical protein